MVESRIKPHNQLEIERVARAEQTRLFRRNQIFGVLVLAVAIVGWWLLHTNPWWIFPAGWRLP